MRIFISGISGLFGLNLALQARDRFQISGCYYAHPVILEGVQTFRLDLTSLSRLEQALLEVGPDVVIHAAGLTNVEECETKPELAYRLNVETTRNVAKVTNTLRAKLVHISTDHLLDGGTPWKTEEAIPGPLNTYAETKWRAEQAVLEECPDALIIRTNFFGWGTPVRVSFSDWILRALAQKSDLTMFSDVYFTPILINDLVDIMTELIARGAEGVLHVAGGERLTKYAFALQLAQVFNHPTHTIRAISVENFPFRAKRPKDMSLSCRNAEAYLGVRMPSVRDGLNRLKRLKTDGFRAALEGAVQGGVSSRGSSQPRAQKRHAGLDE
jgi:dTDP-4-dehydrorhamnose reductase